MKPEEADSIIEQLVLLNQILTIVYANVSGVMSPEVAMEEIKRVTLTENKEK
jgi:hypothetical protein